MKERVPFSDKPMYYDRQGKPISNVLEWGKKFETKDYKRVDLFSRPWVTVSTVWIGLDHNLGSGGEPLIFETMVFDKHGQEVDIERYHSEDQAREGHDRFVKRYCWRLDLWFRRRR